MDSTPHDTIVFSPLLNVRQESRMSSSSAFQSDGPLYLKLRRPRVDFRASGTSRPHIIVFRFERAFHTHVVTGVWCDEVGIHEVSVCTVCF